MTAREWDASTYAHLEMPHVDWGRRVLDRLEISEGGTVLDVGCGTGRDAAALRERRSDVHIVALDGSGQMLDQARATLGPDDVTYVQADLNQPLTLDPVDAVMSVACFHWIPNHDVLFGSLAGVMKPGARLTTDCGGRGNVANLELAVARVTGTTRAAFTNFADEEGTATRLEAAGFDVERVTLRPSPFRIDDPDVFETYLATVCLGAYRADLGEERFAEFVTNVRSAFTEPVLDYVRLEIDAVRV